MSSAKTSRKSKTVVEEPVAVPEPVVVEPVAVEVVADEQNETFESSNKKRRNNTNMIELDDDQIINCEGKLKIYYY